MGRLILAKNWWSLVLRGILAILVGVVEFFSPGITLMAVVFLFAGYALLNGIFCLAGAIRAGETHERWGVLLLEGILGIAAAAVTVFWPRITIAALVFVIAAWAILTGIAELTAAIRLRHHIRGEWLLGLAGVASIVFGILIAARPAVGAVVISLWIGAYLFVFGVLMVLLGFRLRSWLHGHTGAPLMPAPAH